MGNKLSSLEKQLSAIGDRTFPYNATEDDGTKIKKETTGNKLIEQFENKQDKIIKSLIADGITSKSVVSNESAASIASGQNRGGNPFGG